MGPTGLGLGIDRLKAHQAHKPLHPFAVDPIAQAAQMIAHTAATAFFSDRDLKTELA